jgi:hypothetical protein
MKELLSIRASELVRIFKASETDLTPFELAIRETLVKANSEDEMRILIEKASLTDIFSHVQFAPSGRRVTKI